MKYVLAAGIAVLLIGATTSSGQAARRQVRSYESCTDLATQRSFMPAERRGARTRFIKRCMSGAQQ